jgi:hypothetical protein
VAPVSDQVLEEAKSAAGPGSDGWLGEGLEVPLDDLEAPPTLIGEPRLTPSEGSQRRDSVRISAGSAAAAAPAARPAATEDDMDLLHLASLARTAQRQAELPRPSQRLPLDVAALFDEGPTDVGQSPGDSLPRWAGVTAAAAGRAIRPGVEEAETTMPDGPVGVGHGVAGGAALAGSSGKPATSPAHGGQEGSQGGTADGPAAEARTEPPTEQPTDPGKPRRRPLFSSMKKRLLGK